jgi:hypothetical protein
LLPKTANCTQTASPSTDKTAARKQSPETGLEQAALQSNGRKRRLDTPDSIHQSSPKTPRKKARKHANEAVVDSSAEQEEASKVDEDETNPIRYWTKHFKWPKKYFYESNMDMEMSNRLAKKMPSASLRRKRSAAGSIGAASVTSSSAIPSDQQSREVKSAPYKDARYDILLSTKGSFMEDSELQINTKSVESCLNLLDAPQTIPTDSLFRDDLFERTCRNLRGRNETRVIRDISLLIVPSAETLTTYGDQHLGILIESTNDGWNNSIPLTGTRPQPDFSVGFRREAFNQQQLDKLAPFIGDYLSNDRSLFMATYYMYFPFLTAEVKCGAGALDVADRQNAHSMTLAVRATVELFRTVGREMELHREILAFSISHNDKAVNIYGHYPVIDGKDTKYYRHEIDSFTLASLGGRDKWKAYKFTKNVYDVWMPSHFKRLCSAIDQIPADLDFSAPPLSQSFGLSHDFEHHHLSASSQCQGLSQQSPGAALARETTVETPFTDAPAQERPRKRRAGEE